MRALNYIENYTSTVTLQQANVQQGIPHYYSIYNNNNFILNYVMKLIIRSSL